MLGLEGKSEKKNLPTETGYFRGFALQLKKKYQRHRLLGRMCSILSNSGAMVECNDVLAGGI